MPVIFMYSPPSIAAFVFERDRLLGSCSLAPWPLAIASCLLECLLLREVSGCRAPAQQGCRLQSTAGWIYGETRVLWKFPLACISVPRLLQFQGWCGPSKAPLGSTEHLKAPASQQRHSRSMMGEVVVWEQVFSLPRSH